VSQRATFGVLGPLQVHSGDTLSLIRKTSTSRAVLRRRSAGRARAYATRVAVVLGIGCIDGSARCRRRAGERILGPPVGSDYRWYIV